MNDATPALAEAVFSGTYWAVVALTVLLAGLAVWLHYEALERLNFWLPRWGVRPQPRVLLLIIGILLVHTVEIWIFGAGIFWMAQYPSMGWISGDADIRLLDAVYLSATTFTTVGYGDLAPHGPMRFTMGSEALTGSVLITWSASFTFLEMQRFWRQH